MFHCGTEPQLNESGTGLLLWFLLLINFFIITYHNGKCWWVGLLLQATIGLSSLSPSSA